MPKSKTKTRSDKFPKVGSKWIDFTGRVLKVTKIAKTDPNGRQIRGKVTYNPSANQNPEKERTDDYSCSAAIFTHIWRDKKAPAKATDMVN